MSSSLLPSRTSRPGPAAVRALLLIDGEDLGPRLSTYAAPLRTALLRAAGDPDALNAACEYYGELVRRGRDPDVLEAEVRCALDALADETESNVERGSRGHERGREHPLEARLLVAVLTLRQLTMHAPAAIYPHVAAALELWRPLTFPAASVRLAATDALYALLVSVAPRATRYVQQWHKQLLTGASNAFGRDANNHAAVHGGLWRSPASCASHPPILCCVRTGGTRLKRSLGPNQSAFTLRGRRRAGTYCSGATPISPARHCGSWSTSSTSRPACLPHAACRIVCAC